VRSSRATVRRAPSASAGRSAAAAADRAPGSPPHHRTHSLDRRVRLRPRILSWHRAERTHPVPRGADRAARHGGRPVRALHQCPSPTCWPNAPHRVRKRGTAAREQAAEGREPAAGVPYRADREGTRKLL